MRHYSDIGSNHRHHTVLRIYFQNDTTTAANDFLTQSGTDRINSKVMKHRFSPTGLEEAD